VHAFIQFFSANVCLKTINPFFLMPVSTQNFHPVSRTHTASWKGPLDGADTPSFSAGVVDPMRSSRDMPVDLTLQLTRRESSSVIKGETCRCC
jgi:hypothetical protein